MISKLKENYKIIFLALFWLALWSSINTKPDTLHIFHPGYRYIYDLSIRDYIYLLRVLAPSIFFYVKI